MATLKTLKDLKWYECGTGGCGNEECCGSYGEMECTEDRDGTELIYLEIKDLRQNTIKWIKELELKKTKNQNSFPDGYPSYGNCCFCKQDRYDCHCYMKFEAKQDVLIEMFNLTEEELK